MASHKALRGVAICPPGIPGSICPNSLFHDIATIKGKKCASRLARKAESARQARLRHKQFVNDLQQQVDAAQERVRQLESFCTAGPGSAAHAVQELKNVLTPEQLRLLRQWYTQLVIPGSTHHQLV